MSGMCRCAAACPGAGKGWMASWSSFQPNSPWFCKNVITVIVSCAACWRSIAVNGLCVFYGCLHHVSWCSLLWEECYGCRSLTSCYCIWRLIEAIASASISARVTVESCNINIVHIPRVTQMSWGRWIDFRRLAPAHASLGESNLVQFIVVFHLIV